MSTFEPKFFSFSIREWLWKKVMRFLHPKRAEIDDWLELSKRPDGVEPEVVKGILLCFYLNYMTAEQLIRTSMLNGDYKFMAVVNVTGDFINSLTVNNTKSLINFYKKKNGEGK